MPKKIKLYGCEGCGSVIVEKFLKLAHVPYDYVEVDYSKDSPLRDELLSVNPLCQVPTMILPDGKIMTETLAIAHHIQDIASDVPLIPRDKNVRPQFFRWSTFLVSAIYPTWTYGDVPEKWVLSKDAASSLKESTDEHRKKLWLQVEREAQSPYFLGEQMSAIDIYMSVMIDWRPRAEWFQKNCPKIFAIASHTRTKIYTK